MVDEPMVTNTPVEEYDPFAVFEDATGGGHVRNPYAKLAELRLQAPVFEGRLDRVFGLPEMPVVLVSPTTRCFVALSYDAVSHVLLDGQTFSSGGYAQTMGLVMGHSILEMDEPEHRAYRGLIQQAF